MQQLRALLKKEEMTNMTLKRFTGEIVGRFGEQLGVGCDLNDCPEQAVLLPCNAEGDKGRAHHWGGVHDLADNRSLTLCETHGLQLLASNAKIRGED
jgi:hypothetical protein